MVMDRSEAYCRHTGLSHVSFLVLGRYRDIDAYSNRAPKAQMATAIRAYATYRPSVLESDSRVAPAFLSLKGGVEAADVIGDVRGVVILEPSFGEASMLVLLTYVLEEDLGGHRCTDAGAVP